MDKQILARDDFERNIDLNLLIRFSYRKWGICLVCFRFKYIFQNIDYSPNEIEKAKDMDKSKSLEDVLARSVGKWGWFQVWFGVIIYLYESAYAPCVYGPMFTDFTPNHHCIQNENQTFSSEIWENEINR